ncbi:hypothetical protein NKG94_51285 [Micromonospora sp. M12]
MLTRSEHAQRCAVTPAAMRETRFWILAATLIAHGAATSTMTRTSSMTSSAERTRFTALVEF